MTKTQQELKADKRTRGFNYTEEEDVQLCHSWSSVSNDPIKGNDQTSVRNEDRNSRASFDRVPVEALSNAFFCSSSSLEVS
ncbi:hypothetical protein INT47_002569 [Mucor saturninus]|uniref:Uncharacterized protein n=1 Tax=Mucor saturninus TaxID=64648 RepID=A0A8H7QFH4_9FUNG|nr:hypothetical protein INT47_002569 [Mucor saturninus]